MDFDEPQFYKVRSYAKRQDRDVIDLVSGIPDWSPPTPLRDALETFAAAPDEEYQYPPIEGLEELRAEIAAHHDVSTDAVLVTNGGGNANHLAMAHALRRGSGSDVVLTDPVYPYYAGRTTMLGGTQVFVPVEDDGHLDPETVRQAVTDETACVMVNSPNNPTGAVYDEETMRELVAIAEAHDAVLVSDEVYARFAHSTSFTSATEIASAHRIVTGSFSKSLATTGLRVGFAIVPEAHRDEVQTRQMLTNVGISRPAQFAALHALRETPADYYETKRRLIRERIDDFTSALDTVGARYTDPGGAFYVMVRFSDVPGTMDNAYRLIEEAGVACMPGESFGERMSDWFRFALVSPRVEEAADRLVEFF
ncbi:MAG: pyridoxal phosphate-dependent aminotransferase [Haloarculaceae archaeon]